MGTGRNLSHGMGPRVYVSDARIDARIEKLGERPGGFMRRNE